MVRPLRAAGLARAALRLALITLALVAFAEVVQDHVVAPLWGGGTSMLPTFTQGHLYAIIPEAYRFGSPTYGEVVYYDLGGGHMLGKRVLGLSGDVIEFKAGYLYRNGTLVEEPYVRRRRIEDLPPVTVPAGSLYLLGDNRMDSWDSRCGGPFVATGLRGKFWPDISAPTVEGLAAMDGIVEVAHSRC